MSSNGSMLLLLASLVWAALASPSLSLVKEELDALGAFKGAIKDPLGLLASWDTNHSGACGWYGVACSNPQDHVVGLKLFNCSLGGMLSPKIGLLTKLQELTLGGNLFDGVIPKEIGSLEALNLLDLSNNNLSGSIPPEIGGLTNVSKICLSNNQLAGSLPPDLGNLAKLEELKLDGNMLDGEIPATNSSYIAHDSNSLINSQSNATGLCLLSRLKVGDFSSNFFSGEIPSCLAYLPRSSFQGNCLRDRTVLSQRSTKECDLKAIGPSISSGVSSPTDKHGATRPMHERPQQPHWLLILEVVTGIVLVIFIIICLVAASRIRKLESPNASPWNKIEKSRDDIVIPIDNNVLRLSRQELEVACEDFSNIIGSSLDSQVYKGTMKDGAEIAVTSLCTHQDEWTSYHELQFQCEVANFARLDHENVAKLLGYCEEVEPFSRMLVFEYESNGTLSEHLHYGGECQLSWSRRMRIAVGVARALKHMHVELQPPFTLSDLHSGTVYLTEDFFPKVVDFESWKAVLSKSEKSRWIIGQASYDHREYLRRKDMDAHANTFSFGVLLLELISGRPPFCKNRGSLVDWGAEYLEKPDRIRHLVDPELRYFNHNHLQTIGEVVSLCIQSDPSKRPSMEIVAAMLESGIDMSVSDALKESPLSWAELALSS